MAAPCPSWRRNPPPYPKHSPGPCHPPLSGDSPDARHLRPSSPRWPRPRRLRGPYGQGPVRPLPKRPRPERAAGRTGAGRVRRDPADALRRRVAARGRAGRVLALEQRACRRARLDGRDLSAGQRGAPHRPAADGARRASASGQGDRPRRGCRPRRRADAGDAGLRAAGRRDLRRVGFPAGPGDRVDVYRTGGSGGEGGLTRLIRRTFR